MGNIANVPEIINNYNAYTNGNNKNTATLSADLTIYAGSMIVSMSAIKTQHIITRTIIPDAFSLFIAISIICLPNINLLLLYCLCLIFTIIE